MKRVEKLESCFYSLKNAKFYFSEYRRESPAGGGAPPRPHPSEINLAVPPPLFMPGQLPPGHLPHGVHLQPGVQIHPGVHHAPYPSSYTNPGRELKWSAKA